MANITSIDLYNALKPKIGEKEAQMLTEFVEHKTDEVYHRVTAELATKEDLLTWQAATKDDFLSWRAAIKDDFSKWQTTTKDDIHTWQAATKDDISRLDIKISETKSELLKWMIVLFTPLYLSLIILLIKQFV